MTSCLTASKLMAPSRIASRPAAATSVSGKTSAAIAHAGFQEPPQMLERFRKCPVLQGSRLIERAGLLLEERQIVLRVKDELTTAIDARMPGDLARAADDRHLVDEALHQDVAAVSLNHLDAARPELVSDLAALLDHQKT